MDRHTANRHHTLQLRELAEQRLPKSATDAGASEQAQLIYELQIHQEELEIQNEELRRVQLELKASRDRYVDLYDFAPVGYLTLDPQGEILGANLTACRLLGRERSRLIGARLDLLCEAGSRTNLRTHLDRVSASGDQQYVEVQIIAEESEESTWVSLQSCRSRGDDGSVRLRSVMTDVSVRRRAEQIALEKDRHLRSMANALPVLISYLDADLRYRFCNLAHEDWFGVSPELLYGQTPQEAIAENVSDEVFDYMADALEGRKVSFESVLQDRGQRSHHVQVMLVPDIGKAENVLGVHALFIDVTERKLIDEQNSRRRALAEKLEQLTPDERRVYELMVCGKPNKFVALKLDIGLRTAERRRRRVLQKLGVESVAELLQELANIQRLGGSGKTQH